jgi:hypothetical protein
VIVQDPSTSLADRIQVPKLTLNNVVAVLQVVLATRRAARNEDLGLWYTIARGM